MLQRTTTSGSWLSGRPGTWHETVRQGFGTSLLRYLFVVVALCILACVYLWQASSVSEIYKETRHLQLQAAKAEEQNVALTKQWAVWNTPSYVEGRIREEGYVKAPPVVYTSLSAVAAGPMEHAAQTASTH